MSLRPLLESWRLGNALIAGASVVLGAWLQVPVELGVQATPWNTWGLWAGALALVFLVGAGNIHNDCVDIHVDRLNCPNRALPAGRWTLAQAQAAWLVCGLVALSLGALASLEIFLQVVGMSVLLVLYNLKLKGTPLVGNFVVALLCAWAVALAVEGPWSPLVWVAGSFAFVLTMLREMVKDIQDFEGDGAKGVRSTAVVLGPLLTWDLVRMGAAVTVLLLPLPWQVGWVSGFFGVGILVLVGAPLMFLVRAKEPTELQVTRMSRLLKWAMLGGILILILEKGAWLEPYL
jgi:geranylgeranylglycerol-phosphate geranylgeranyltransferase